MSDLVRGSTPARPAPRTPDPPAEQATDAEAADQRAPAAATPVADRPADPSPRPRLTALTVRGVASAAASRAAESAPAIAPAEPAVAGTVSGESSDEQIIFGDLVAFLERVRGLVGTRSPFPWGELDRLVHRVISALTRSADLFWIANAPAVRPGADDLAIHQARVAVLAIRIGSDVGVLLDRLLELGMAGALIDVGLWAMTEGGERPDPASAEFRAHPRVSAEIVQGWRPPRPSIVQAVLEHHERGHGQGFPRGLTRESIHLHAQVLGLVDRYAGLTGPGFGPGRGRPHEVIRGIVRSKSDEFPPALVKALLSEISIFPPGTSVRLSTGELGRVVGVNRNHPLRPRVEVRSDAKGQPLPWPRTLDLAETPFLYITGPAAEGS